MSDLESMENDIEFLDTEDDAKSEEKRVEAVQVKKPKILYAIYALVALVCVAFCVFYVINRQQEKKEEMSSQTNEEKVYKVSVIEVSPTGNDVYLTYTGIVQPGEMEQATFTAMGTVKEIYVTEGQEVKAGDLLAIMDDSDAMRQIESSENSLNIARTNLNTAINQRQKAYEDYLKACSPDDAKETLDSATSRRDEQQAKVDSLSGELVVLEQAQEAAKAEYEQAGKDLLAAQGELSAKTAELNALKEAVGTDEALILAKQMEVDVATQKVTECEIAYGTKQSTYTTAQAEYRTKQVESDAAQATLVTYNETVDSAQSMYEDKLEDGSQAADAKAQAEVFNAADASYYTSQATYDSALSNYENALESLEDYKLYAKNDGYVITVSATEGSVATPIAPAVVIGSNENVVSFGVSQSDIRDIKVGQSAEITVNGKKFIGEVKSVGLLPDETSRTYATEVSIEAEDVNFYLGELATVKIAIGEREGVWLPLSVILNDGQDYVYMVENGRAKRQNVVITEISNDMVMVTGMPDGGLVISEGMKLVRTGSAVSIE